MTNSNDRSMAEWFCPACNTGQNSYGSNFSGCNAVALHVAGKIRSGDRLHERWALKVVGESISEPSVRRTINTLADAMYRAVREAEQIRRALEDERIARLVEEKQSAASPDVQAYVHTTELEKSLHKLVRLTLMESFGEDEHGWWAMGIPLQIRKNCATRREEDSLREEAYVYTDLIDLKEIIDKKWRVFEPEFQLIRQHIKTKSDLLDSIVLLNDIRRRVMHPTRMNIASEELSFLSSFRDAIRSLIDSD